MYNVDNLLLQRSELCIEVNLPLWQLYCDRPRLFIRSIWWSTAVRTNGVLTHNELANGYTDTELLNYSFRPDSCVGTKFASPGTAVYWPVIWNTASSASCQQYKMVTNLRPSGRFIVSDNYLLATGIVSESPKRRPAALFHQVQTPKNMTVRCLVSNHATSN
jgi:hypothetical protein